MASLVRVFVRAVLLGCFILVLITISLVYDDQAAKYGTRNRELARTQDQAQQKNHRLNLDDKECRAAFPGLFTDIDASVAKGEFKLDKTAPDYKGLVQGRILNNNLHILTTSPDTLPQMLHQRTSILTQIHRALITSPFAVPNTHFALTINDVPKNNSWGFARPAKHSGYNTWIMPSFAGWSWAKPGLGSMDDVVRRIGHVEGQLDWEEKDARVVWRGTAWFNPIGQPDLRKKLVKAAKGEEWADVQALNASNVLMIEDFCRYKYVVYAEGVTYSGRLPYHQACRSVLLMAPLGWITTTALLLRPIWARDLMGEVGGGKRREEVKGALPTVSSYEDANAIYVHSDFSNLEGVVQFLDKHPEIAKRIARNQRDLMVGGGYLSLAAETCYWRALIRGWGEVAVVDEEWGNDVGERYETWLLNEVSRARGGTRGKNERGGGGV